MRLKAQNNKKHYEAKYAEEKKKVEKVEDQAKLLQEEFTVSFKLFLSCLG